MKRKPVRLAIAALVAVLSVLGVTTAAASPSVVSATGNWCC